MSVGGALPRPVGGVCPGFVAVDVTVVVVCVVVTVVELPPHPVVSATLVSAILRPAPVRRRARPDHNHQNKRDTRLAAHR